jgi:hypothetical protein
MGFSHTIKSLGILSAGCAQQCSACYKRLFQLQTYFIPPLIALILLAVAAPIPGCFDTQHSSDIHFQTEPWNLTIRHTENLRPPCKTPANDYAWGSRFMRSLCLVAFGCLVGLLVYTYNLKLKTRALEGVARDLVTTLQDEGDFLALMRAEVSYLSRPERIDDMARKTLKLEPIASGQLVPWSAVVADSSAAWPHQAGQTPRKDGIAALIEKIAPPAAPQPAR